MYRYPGFNHYYHRRPSRILWFILGAGTAFWFMKHRQLCSEENRFGFCRRAPIQAPPSIRHAQQNSSESEDTMTGPQGRSQPGRDFGNQQWEQDKARLMAMGQQAGAAMSELTEESLDSVLDSMTSLKAKLAQYRAEREQRRRHDKAENDSPPTRIV